MDGGTHEEARRAEASPARRALGALVALALVLSVLPLVITPGVAERFLFLPGRTDPGPAPVLAGVEGRDIFLRTGDGVRVHGWWHRAAPEAPAVLFLHGNAGTIAGRTPLAAGYLARGVSVFMLDYRGYGRSEGRPTEDGVLRDAVAALDFLEEELGDPGRIVLHGRSLGGAVAAGALRHRRAAGVILEATFTRFDEMAKAAYPILPSFVFRRLRDRFDVRGAVAGLEIPLLVVHGTADRLVPPAMGRALYEAAPGAREWYPVEGAGHNDVFAVGGSAYFDRLVRFVAGTTGTGP